LPGAIARSLSLSLRFPPRKKNPPLVDMFEVLDSLEAVCRSRGYRSQSGIAWSDMQKSELPELERDFL
jgi:hypothetical protein